MNERIKKLAEQAGFYGDPLFENLELFAELVIADYQDRLDDWYPMPGKNPRTVQVRFMREDKE